jgi:hypothetical protein
MSAGKRIADDEPSHTEKGFSHVSTRLNAFISIHATTVPALQEQP